MANRHSTSLTVSRETTALAKPENEHLEGGQAVSLNQSNRAEISEIVRQSIDTYDEKLCRRLDKQDNVLEKQNGVLAGQNGMMQQHALKLTRIESKIDDLCGTQGVPGILDKIQNTQNTLESAFYAEKQEQSDFRNELRAKFEVDAAKAKTRSETDAKWKKRVRYMAAPGYVTLWEVLKHIFLGSRGK